MDNGFYLKLTKEESNKMVIDGFLDLFGGKETKRFEDYTYAIEDESNGDLYWKIENLQYDGILYDCIGWVNKNYPDLKQYSHDFVKQFIPINKEI
jgi:hypothetical protein